MGSIYKTTNWGIGVCTSKTGWASIYKAIAGCETPLQIQYSERVTADNGIIESLQCVKG